MPEAKKRKYRGPVSKQREFLDAYEQHGNLSEAARERQISLTSHYDWVARDETYQKMFAASQLKAAENVEKARQQRITEYARKRRATGRRLLEEALGRVFHGVPKPLWYKNEPRIDPETGRQAVEVQKGDHLLISMLRAYLPDMFGSDIQVTQQTGIQVQQIAGDVAAMAASIQPPAEAIQAAVRARIVQEHEAGKAGPNGNGSNGNGHANGNGDSGERPSGENGTGQ